MIDSFVAMILWCFKKYQRWKIDYFDKISIRNKNVRMKG